VIGQFLDHLAFDAVLRDATLLLATDGLLKYGQRDRIAVLTRGADPQAAGGSSPSCRDYDRARCPMM